MNHERLFVVPETAHNQLVRRAFAKRGYHPDEVQDITRLCADAARHGIRTHNALKALHLDKLFGSQGGGCVPGAEIVEIPSRFPAVKIWNANKKPGPTVAYRALEACIALADSFGTGTVTVDNAFHYLWGGGYVMEAARRGYIAYTQCTALLAEVVPFGGKTPTLGTNPHSWGFPTMEAVGFPIVVDWATSAVAKGRVQQLEREGKLLPPGCAVDADGQITLDPSKAAALLPFGGHKGYGLGLIDEIMAAFIGGSLPTLRGRYAPGAEKHTTCFFFSVIHPEALNARAMPHGRTAQENVRAVLQDVLGHGNENAILPGQVEAQFASLCAQHGGLLFTRAELDEFNHLALECGEVPWNLESFTSVMV